MKISPVIPPTPELGLFALAVDHQSSQIARNLINNYNLSQSGIQYSLGNSRERYQYRIKPREQNTIASRS
jgi:hypothetical protein